MSDMNQYQVRRLIILYKDLTDHLISITEDSGTSSSTLEKLATLGNSSISGMVDLNPNTSWRLLEKRLEMLTKRVGKDEGEESRIHIVGNPSLRLSRLRQSALNDPSPEVRSMAWMMMAKRLALRAQATASQLLELYGQLGKNVPKTRSCTIRIKKGKCYLLQHPQFPHEKLGKDNTRSQKTRK